MGKAALYMVLGFIVIFGMVRINIDKTSESASLNSSEYTERILARNVANMATEYLISIYAETGADSGIVDTNFLGGSYSATFSATCLPFNNDASAALPMPTALLPKN